MNLHVCILILLTLSNRFILISCHCMSLCVQVSLHASKFLFLNSNFIFISINSTNFYINKLNKFVKKKLELQKDESNLWKVNLICKREWTMILQRGWFKVQNLFKFPRYSIRIPSVEKQSRFNLSSRSHLANLKTYLLSRPYVFHPRVLERRFIPYRPRVSINTGKTLGSTFDFH